MCLPRLIGPAPCAQKSEHDDDLAHCLQLIRRMCTVIEEEQADKRLEYVWNVVCFRLDLLFLFISNVLNLTIGALWFLVDHTD
jgi:hypothetical protein